MSQRQYRTLFWSGFVGLLVRGAIAAGMQLFRSRSHASAAEGCGNGGGAAAEGDGLRKPGPTFALLTAEALRSAP
jgi:hypothetical protein